jgi:1-acyl-sn-glycerol-3-phosphate acyltransferase
VYRLDKHNVERIPLSGPALLVCNHVSYLDALVIAAACRRPIRFVMDHRIFRWPLLSFVFRTARAIPIAPAKENAALLEKAYDEVASALAAGELVAIFPEGRLSEDGELGPFRPGIQRILERHPVAVLPMALSGLWDSPFSRQAASLLQRLGQLHPLRRIALSVGEPVAPLAVEPEALRQQVLELRGVER